MKSKIAPGAVTPLPRCVDLCPCSILAMDSDTLYSRRPPPKMRNALAGRNVMGVLSLYLTAAGGRRCCPLSVISSAFDTSFFLEKKTVDFNKTSPALATAALRGQRLSSRSSEGVTTEFRFTGLDVGEGGYRVPAGTLLSQ